MREGEKLTHTMLTHTVLICVLHPGCAVAGPAAIQPPPLLRALEPTASQQPGDKRLRAHARADSRAALAATAATVLSVRRLSLSSDAGAGGDGSPPSPRAEGTLPPLAHGDTCATLAAAANSSADANRGAEHAQLKRGHPAWRQQQHRRRGRRRRAAAAARACVTAAPTARAARGGSRRPRGRSRQACKSVANEQSTTTWARAAAARRRRRARLRGVARSPKRAARGDARHAYAQVGSGKTARHTKFHQSPLPWGPPPSILAPRRESLRETSCA